MNVTTNFGTVKIVMLKGEKGDKFQYDDYTPEELESLRGEKGDPFTYDDFTEEQLTDLRSSVASAYYRKIDATYYTIGDNTETIPIPIEGYNDSDMLFIDVEGLALTEGVDYTIDGSNIVLANPITHNYTAVNFRAIRSFAITTEDYDSLIGDLTSDIDTYVNEWLTEHPEATTTVQDGSITNAKLAQTGGIFSEVYRIVPLYGSWFSTGGNMQPNNRVHSDLQYVPAGTEVRFNATGYKVEIVEYSGTNGQSGSGVLFDSGWKSDGYTYTVQNHCYLDVVVAKSNDATIESVSEYDGKTSLLISNIIILDSAVDMVNLEIGEMDDFYSVAPGNGSAGNPGNTNVVCIRNFNAKVGDVFKVIIGKPLDDGHYYTFGWRFTDMSGNAIRAYDYTSDSTSPYIPVLNDATYNNAGLLAVVIAEYDENGTIVPRRANDYAAYPLLLKKVEIGDKSDTVSSLLLREGYVSCGFALWNGTPPNAGNAYSICTTPISANVGDTFTILPASVPTDGRYVYGFTEHNGNVSYVSMLRYIETGSNYENNVFEVANPNTTHVRLLIAKMDANNNYVPIRAHNSDVNDNEFLILKQTEENGGIVKIVERNADVLPMVYSAGNYGANGNGVPNNRKCLSMLVTTDVHRCADQMSSAIQYLNNIDSIDCGICLGDMAAGNFTESDGTWYTGLVNGSNKPFYTILGNHDGGNSTNAAICGTVQQTFDKFIKPTREVMGMSSLEVPYYKVDFADYPVSLICLNNYDTPDTLSGGNYVIHRGGECISQEQLDWFVSALQSVPTGNHLIIARHSGAGASWVTDESAWTQPNTTISTSNVYYGNGLPINDIVEAWRNGGTLVKTYAPTAETDYLPVLSVNADFTSRGVGIFACYILGHSHKDTIAHDANGQLAVQLAATANDNWQNYDSDLPRAKNMKSEDCLTVLGIDTAQRLVKLVRVGSNVTMRMTKRDMLAISY